MNNQELEPKTSSHHNASSQQSPKKSGKMGDLPIRIVSAIILALVVVGFLWLGGVGFTLLMCLMAALIHWEWGRMVKTETSITGRSVSWAFLIISLGAMIVEEWFISALVLGIGFLLLFVLCIFEKKRAWSPVGLVYAVGGAMGLVLLRLGDQTGILMILFLFILVWMTDICAYFSGRFVGGPKFAPRISPKKTWAGFIGGVSIGTACAALFFHHFVAPISFFGIVITLALSIFSQLSDLFESWIKRRFNIKDSSNIIPGHGGVMDRVDGLSPTAALFAVLAIMMLYFNSTTLGNLGLDNIAVAAKSLLN